MRGSAPSRLQCIEHRATCSSQTRTHLRNRPATLPGLPCPRHAPPTHRRWRDGGTTAPIALWVQQVQEDAAGERGGMAGQVGDQALEPSSVPFQARAMLMNGEFHRLLRRVHHQRRRGSKNIQGCLLIRHIEGAEHPQHHGQLGQDVPRPRPRQVKRSSRDPGTLPALHRLDHGQEGLLVSPPAWQAHEGAARPFHDVERAFIWLEDDPLLHFNGQQGVRPRPQREWRLGQERSPSNEVRVAGRAMHGISLIGWIGAASRPPFRFLFAYEDAEPNPTFPRRGGTPANLRTCELLCRRRRVRSAACPCFARCRAQPIALSDQHQFGRDDAEAGLSPSSISTVYLRLAQEPGDSWRGLLPRRRAEPALSADAPQPRRP